MSPDKPNIVVVIVDCARVVDFPPASKRPETTPYLTDLEKESVTFVNAFSTSNWTLPAHASILTGLYPWQHGVHGKAQTSLRAHRTVFDELRSLGYRAALLSANPHIDEGSGMTAGADFACHGTWPELYLRSRSLSRFFRLPATESGSRTDQPDEMYSILDGFLRRHGGRFTAMFPRCWDGALRVLSKVSRENFELSSEVSPWIEDTLSSWIARQADGDPIIAFVNLMDCHEPYLLRSPKKSSLRDWWELGRANQDHVSWLVEGWSPGPDDVQRLHALYLGSLAHVDQRIRRITQILEKHNRWENTLFIVTGDHGQQLGEDGVLFHGFRDSESLTRVPLIVRLPGRRLRGRVVQNSASIIDIYPTALELAGGESNRSLPGVSLIELVSRARDSPVFSLSDGVPWNRWPYLNPDRKEYLDQFSISCHARHGRFTKNIKTGKMQVHPTGSELGALRIGDNPIEVGAETLSMMDTICSQLRTIQRGPNQAEPADHLSGWGY